MQLPGIFQPYVYWIRVALFMLPFIHAIINPIIYFAMSRNFRRLAVKKMKHCYKCQPTAGISSSATFFGRVTDGGQFDSLAI